jgi:hypothetical protein
LVSPQNLIWRLVQVAKRRPERVARVDRIQEPLPHPYREPGLSPRAVHGGPGSRPLSIQARRAKRVTAHTAAACRVEVINSSSWLTKLTSCFRASTDHDAPLGRLLGRKPPVDAKGDRWNRLARDCASTRKRRDRATEPTEPLVTFKRNCIRRALPPFDRCARGWDSWAGGHRRRDCSVLRGLPEPS